MSLARHRELLVLGAVRSHSIHGYALVEALAAGLGKALGIKRPTVYALLSRLEEQGLVTHKAEKDSVYPERRVYRVTRKGRSAIPELAHASVKSSIEAAIPLAVIIAHLDELSADERIEILVACRDALQSSLADLESIPEHPGNAGVALDLVSHHYNLDLDTVNRLLLEAGGTS